jgi:hypothetical protein
MRRPVTGRLISPSRDRNEPLNSTERNSDLVMLVWKTVKRFSPDAAEED